MNSKSKLAPVIEETKAYLDGDKNDSSFKLGGHLANRSLSNMYNPGDEMLRFKDVKYEPRYMLIPGKDGTA